MKKLVLSLAIVAAAASMAGAQAPAKFNYQGIARNAAGGPLANQNLGLRLTIHDGSATGAIVYQELQIAPTNAFGLYNIAIGTGTIVTGTLAGVNWVSGDKFMQVELDPAAGSNYTDLGTTQLLSVPFAMSAMKADSAMHAPAPTLAVTGNSLTAGGNTITLPSFTLPFSSSTSSSSILFDITNTGTSGGVKATTASTTNAAVHGVLTASTGAANIAAVRGENQATGSGGNGVYGSHAGGGSGVYGSAGNGTGVLGQSNSGFGVLGSVTGTGFAGYFDGGSANGKGLVVANGRSGFGTAAPKVKLEVASAAAGDSLLLYNGVGSGPFNFNAAALIQNTSVSSTNEQASLVVRNIAGGNFSNHGIYSYVGNGGGVTVGGSMASVFANARNFGGIGTTYGLLGMASGTAATTGNVYGLYSTASTAGSGTAYAGYFSGNVQIVGSIAKSSGTFKIDHPLDPENKYLYHSFVESPDMMNIYNGNIVTDARGYATVNMPSYFDALNKDFRYQLTVIGTFAQAIVKEEMQGNTFVIQTNQPNVKVSWQVTGVRHDKYADAHRIQPEVEKEKELKGYYLNAAEWNQPESKSINAAIAPEAGSVSAAAEK